MKESKINGSVEFNISLEEKGRKKSTNNKKDDISKEMKKLGEEIRNNELKEPGKTVSVYFNYDTLNILETYMKKNHIKNRSTVINMIITTFLK